jgi:hypothetical protein
MSAFLAILVLAIAVASGTATGQTAQTNRPTGPMATATLDGAKDRPVRRAIRALNPLRRARCEGRWPAAPGTK